MQTVRVQGAYHRCLSAKPLDMIVSRMICREASGNILWRCREKQAEVEGFPYGLSVESFFPSRLARRTMPGDRSLGLKSTLRRCS